MPNLPEIEAIRQLLQEGDFSNPALIDAVEGRILAMGDSDDIGRYADLFARAVAAAGQWQRAAAIARSIRSLLDQASSLRFIARQLARSGGTDQAIALLDDAVAAVEAYSTSIDRPNPVYQGAEEVDAIVGHEWQKAQALRGSHAPTSRWAQCRRHYPSGCGRSL